MTQSSEHPQDGQGSPGAVPPTQGEAPPMPPPAPEPYPAAPPISEPYGGGGPPGVTGELAGRWPRLFAAIIDSFIVGVIGWLIALPIVGGAAMTDTKDLGARFTAGGISGVIAIIYFGLQHGRWGQSIGKRVLGMRVVRVADAGPIGYGAAFGRALFTYVLSVITFNVGALVDVIFILWDPRKQALHDKVVKTVVVNADGPDPYAGA